MKKQRYGEKKGGNWQSTLKQITIQYLTYIVCVLSRVWLFATPWTVARQAPLCMEFSRQEYWNGLPFPPPGHLPNPEIKPMSLASVVKNLCDLGSYRPDTHDSSVRFTYSSPLATHSSTLAWRVPRTEETGGRQSMESQRVGHNWVTNIFTLHFSADSSFLGKTS